jgi:ABC-2 type transport system permease protein
MRLFPHELKGQMRLYWRSRELAFFTFALPIIMFFLLGSVYGKDRIKAEGGVRGADYLLAGMLGYGAIATGFAGLSIMLVIRRESGILKRLRATPLPAATYIAALLATTLLAFALEAVVMIAVGRIFFDTHVQNAISLALALLLGAATFTALGLALTSVIRSAEGSSAVVNAIYLPVSFISGAFFSSHSFPDFLRAIADVLPLVYVIQLVRDIMLRGVEIWDRPEAVAIVAAWGLFGALVAARRFRWEPAEG